MARPAARRRQPGSFGLGRGARERQRDGPLFEMLVRGAVLAIRQRRALARLALARGRPAARRGALAASLQLLVDVGDRALDVVVDHAVDARLLRDREEMADLV